jgi:hypothetical protein
MMIGTLPSTIYVDGKGRGFDDWRQSIYSESKDKSMKQEEPIGK